MGHAWSAAASETGWHLKQGTSLLMSRLLAKGTVRKSALGFKKSGDELFAITKPIFTALHGMQTRSSDENSVRPSVRLSVRHTRGL